MATVAKLCEAAGFERITIGKEPADGANGLRGAGSEADIDGVNSAADMDRVNGAADMGGGDRKVESVYCCDLLSVAMGKAPAGCAWVTVIGNINVVAVAALADAACVIVADGAAIEPRAVEKAAQQGVTLLKSALPVFETALRAHGIINGPAA